MHTLERLQNIAPIRPHPFRGAPGHRPSPVPVAIPSPFPLPTTPHPMRPCQVGLSTPPVGINPSVRSGKAIPKTLQRLPRRATASPVATAPLRLESHGVGSTPCRPSTPVRPPASRGSPLWPSPVTATPPAGESESAPPAPCQYTGCGFSHTVGTGKPAVDAVGYTEKSGPRRPRPDGKGGRAP